MFRFRIINAPGPDTIALLSERMNIKSRKKLENDHFDSVLLVQADLPDLFYFADIGQKAGAVVAVELNGSCPQHMSTVAFLGDTDSVNAAIHAIHAARNDDNH